MPRKRYTPESFVAKLRQVDVPACSGPEHCWRYSSDRRERGRLREAQIVIESWRRHFNTVRPHESLGYKPPAPEAFVPALAAWPAALHRPAPPATLAQQPRLN